MTDHRDPISNLYQSFPLAPPRPDNPPNLAASSVRPFALRFAVPVNAADPEPSYRYDKRLQVNVNDAGFPVCKHRGRPTSVRKEIETHPDGSGPNPPPPDRTVTYDPD